MVMIHTENHEQVPGQQKTVHKTLRTSVTMETTEDAEDLFLLAKERLTDVNRWYEMKGCTAFRFALSDSHKHPVHRFAHTGDYINPAEPGSNDTEYTHIELIRYDDYPDENSEIFTLTLQPCIPAEGQGGAAEMACAIHVERHQQVIMAQYHGHFAGAASLPWQQFIEGLIDIPE